MSSNLFAPRSTCLFNSLCSVRFFNLDSKADILFLMAFLSLVVSPGFLRSCFHPAMRSLLYITYLVSEVGLRPRRG